MLSCLCESKGIMRNFSHNLMQQSTDRHHTWAGAKPQSEQAIHMHRSAVRIV